MEPEQEIRTAALKLKIDGVSALASACIIANRDYEGKGLWTDGDLEEFCDYIRDGKKPSRKSKEKNTSSSREA